MHVLSDSTPKGGGFSGPHFGAKEEEVDFEVTHIPDRRGTTESQTYRDRHLHIFIPKKFEDAKPHLDPDFDNFTYGEPVEQKRRIAMLEDLDPGDYILFAASLAPTSREGYQDRSKAAIQSIQRGSRAKYVVGFFQVQCRHTVQRQGHIEPMIYPEDSCAEPGSRLRRNAHFKTLDSHDFVVVVGVADRHRARLKKAVRFTDFERPFRPTRFGVELKGPKGFPRGWKSLTGDQVQAGLSRIRLLSDP